MGTYGNPSTPRREGLEGGPKDQESQEKNGGLQPRFFQEICVFFVGGVVTIVNKYSSPFLKV